MYCQESRMKKSFALFAFLFMVVLSAFADTRFTLVIDAGHGGHDFGAPGAVSNEKDLTLKYALAFGALVEKNCPDVKVIYTRKKDVFLPLHQRADIANDAKADLFVSVHINALDGNHSAMGFQSYTLGRGNRTGDRGLKQNLEVAKRENSVIFLEKDYKKQYRGLDLNSAEGDIMFEFIADNNRARSVDLSRMMQREVCKTAGRKNGGAHQNNLAVLRLTSMPAILLELGFISTPAEENYLNSRAGLDAVSKGIYNAFIQYKQKYDTGIDVPYRVELPAAVPNVDDGSDDNTVQRPVASPDDGQQQKETSRVRKSVRRDPAPTMPVRTAKADESRPVFKIQILSSSNILKPNDKHFKGLNGCERYDENGLHKYTYGASNNYNEIYRLRKQIVEQFPDCFIIAFKNGKKMDVNEGIREFKRNR